MEEVRENIIEETAEVVDEIVTTEPMVNTAIEVIESESGIGWKEVLTGAGVLVAAIGAVCFITHKIRKNKKAKKGPIEVDSVEKDGQMNDDIWNHARHDNIDDSNEFED